MEVFEYSVESTSVPGRSSVFESGKIRTLKNTGWDTDPSDVGDGNIIAKAPHGDVSFRIASWIEQTLKRVEQKHKDKDVCDDEGRQ